MDTIEAQAPPAPPPEPRYEQCGQCGSPVEPRQRYCVVCGFHRRHVKDPAARYLTTASSRTRGGSHARGRRRSSGWGLALLMAAVPLAVGLGVVVGRSSNNGDSGLLAALRAQKPEVITTGGGTSAQASTSSTALSSSFPLQDGYTIELRTLPGSGATQTSVAAAEHAAQTKGAPQVGLILQSDYHVSPSPPSGALVIYSGAFATKPKAQAALAKLAKSFRGAQVVHVQSSSGGGTAAGGGKVLAKTNYGTVNQIAGFHASKTQLAQGEQVVKKIQQTEGKSYVNAQRGLPSQISIP